MAKVEVVTDLPIWEDCPYRGEVPAAIEIRRGTPHEDQGEVIVFWWPKYGLRVDCVADEATLTDADRIVPPALANLCGAVFEQEYPGVYSEIVKARVKSFDGEEVPAHLLPALKRFQELEDFRRG